MRQSRALTTAFAAALALAIPAVASASVVPSHDDSAASGAAVAAPAPVDGRDDAAPTQPTPAEGKPAAVEVADPDAAAPAGAVDTTIVDEGEPLQDDTVGIRHADGSITNVAGTGVDVAGLQEAEAVRSIADDADNPFGDPQRIDAETERASVSGGTTYSQGLPLNLTPPAGFSLEEYAPTAGSQGRVNACVAWAIGYTGVGLLAKEQNIPGPPMAPMSLYHYINGGRDAGAFPSQALPTLQVRGVDTKADYQPQGDYNWWQAPTAAQQANAKKFRIQGWYDLGRVPDRKLAIKQAIASGMPVPVAFEVTPSFSNMFGRDQYNPGQYEPVVGSHEVTIIGYDDNGVRVQNSWGTQWGVNGRFTAPWSWILGNRIQAVHVMGKLVSN